jgi:hypothetical protein
MTNTNTAPAAPIAYAPAGAAYTRHTVSDATRMQTFSVYDDERFAVGVVTTVSMKGWTYPMTTVAHVTREEAREIYRRALAEGLTTRESFRSDRFGSAPAQAA